MKNLCLTFFLVLISSSVSANTTLVDHASDIKKQEPKFKLTAVINNPCDVRACGFEISLLENFEKTANEHCSSLIYGSKAQITKDNINRIEVNGHDRIEAFDVDLEATCIK